MLPGDIVFSSTTSNGVYHVTPPLGPQTLLFAAGNLVDGIAVDETGGILFTRVASPDEELVRLDPMTGLDTVLTTLPLLVATDLAVEDDGKILVVAGGGTFPQIIRYDPVMDSKTDATDGLSDLNSQTIGGIAIEGDGNIIFSLPILQEIRRINRITKVDTVVSSGGDLTNPAGVAIAPNGDIIVADPGAGMGMLSPEKRHPDLLAASKAKGVLDPEEVIRIDPISGVQTVIAADNMLVSPNDVALEENGDILVTNNAEIIRLTGGTGFLSADTAVLDTPVYAQQVISTPAGSWNLDVAPCAPSIANVTPSTIPAGDAATLITVTGSCFIASSVASFNGMALPTTVLGAGSLEAMVPAAQLATAGVFDVVVTNPPPAGGPSGPFSISVNDPAISSLAPPNVCAGDPAFVNLTVNGANFAAGAIVNWDAAQLGTTFVNSTLLNAAPQGLHNTVGTPSITVVNNPGGVASTGFSFPVVGPSNSGLNPLSTIVGGPSFPLIVTGGCFVMGSTVLFNGTPVATVVNTGGQVTGTIPAALIAVIGTVPVQVMNPGGALSASLNFDINNPVPTLTALGQNSATAGDPGFMLTLTGGGFVNGSTVLFDGVAQPATFVSDTTLEVMVTAA